MTRQSHGDPSAVNVRQPLAPRLAELPFGPRLDRASHRGGEVQVIGDVRQPYLPPVSHAKDVHLSSRLLRRRRLASQHEGLRSPRAHYPAAENLGEVRRALLLDPTHAPDFVRGVQPLVEGPGHHGIPDAGDNLGGAAAVDDQPLHLGEPSLPYRLHPIPRASRRETHRARLLRAPLAAIRDPIHPLVPGGGDLHHHHPPHDFVRRGAVLRQSLNRVPPRDKRDGLLHRTHARDDLLGARQLVLALARGLAP
mmetsp:Transcript_2624/g.9782  ORF Transcript_2624/g.9782 Transcript_2624/m.9782 type:complete len:252 (+) Transcript_2624:138-893(+)